MSDLMWSIMAMALAVYAMRLGGLMLADKTIPPRWEDALGYAPIATLTALVVSGLGHVASGGMTELAAVAGAGVVAWRTRRGWLAIPTGLAIFWALRWTGA